MLLKNIRKTAAAIFMIAIAAAVLLINQGSRGHLMLCNNDTGEIYARYPLDEGDSFSIGFIHSVNNSPVIEKYQIIKGEIYVVECIYSQFGAGVQTEILPGQRLSYGENGEMIISNIDTLIEHLSYMVGTWSDHVLEINGEKISLRDTCGRSSLVRFSYIKGN